MSDEIERLGLTVVHKEYVSYSHAHYAGNLVDGAYSLAKFGDVATELCIRSDGDEGLFAGYSDVSFHAPLHAGDVLQTTAEIIKVGRRSRQVKFTAEVVCRGTPEVSASAAKVCTPPILITAAVGTVVVPGPPA